MALLFPLAEELVHAVWTNLRVVISIAIGILATVWLIQRALFG